MKLMESNRAHKIDASLTSKHVNPTNINKDMGTFHFGVHKNQAGSSAFARKTHQTTGYLHRIARI